MCLTVTSSHVNVSAHNVGHLNGTYGRIRENNPISSLATILQLVILKGWLYKFFFSILRARLASFDCEAKLVGDKELQVPADKAIILLELAVALYSFLRCMLRKTSFFI
jgi:hypothetical protein